jgi:hypothetical protein
MELVVGGSETDRREGIRGAFVAAGEVEFATSTCGDTAPGAKSWDSSGALGAVLGGVAIVEVEVDYSDGMRGI